MPRPKTSNAIVLSVRLNPATNVLHAQAIEVWRQAQQRGIKAQEFLLEAIMQYGGHDSATIVANDPLNRIMARLEAIGDVRTAIRLAVADALRDVDFSDSKPNRQRLPNSESDADGDESPLIELTPFARNLANGIMARMKGRKT